MARYKVIETSFDGYKIVQPGEFVEHEFPEGVEAGPNLELVEDEVAPKAKKSKGKAADPAEQLTE